jgi:hypothetical protein
MTLIEVAQDARKLGEDLSECLYQCSEFLPLDKQEMIRLARWKAEEIAEKLYDIEMDANQTI